MSHNPLESLKVVELASVLAGPSVGMFFAEMGARVIKIENKKTGGDVTRSWKLASEDPKATVSAYFSSINYHKEYYFFDFEKSDDLAKVRREILDADIVIANFKRGSAEKFGLNYSSLRQLNPKLIYATISGFGEESDRVAYDLILQAESGFMSMNGTEDSGPVKMPVALIDVLAGHQLKEGILVALLERQNNQKGCKVHVSLFDSALASLVNQASNWLMNQHIPQRIGSKHPNIAPYGELFPTSDQRLVTLAVGSDQQFRKLCELLNSPEISDQELYRTNQQRVRNRESLALILVEKIGKFSSDVFLEKMHASLIPAALIKSMDEVFQNSETQKLILDEVIDGQETRRVRSNVFKITH